MRGSYAEFVEAGVLIENEGPRDRLLLGALGLGGEAGEVIDLIKKHVFHGKPMDEAHMKLELGDVLWYIQLLCTWYGWSLSQVMEANVEKLKARYPDRYEAF